jgi:hypothetical protein
MPDIDRLLRTNKKGMTASDWLCRAKERLRKNYTKKQRLRQINRKKSWLLSFATKRMSTYSLSKRFKLKKKRSPDSKV